MKLLRLSATCAVTLIGLSTTALAQTERKASEFFPVAGDTRKVIFIETTEDEVLVFDAAENDKYVTSGRILAIVADKVTVRGKVEVRSFPANSEADKRTEVGDPGPDGGDGGPGVGDGAHGGRGGRAGRGGDGKPGLPGAPAAAMTWEVAALSFAGPGDVLQIVNTGQKGGKGGVGGQGGTGGRGGPGQSRTCCPGNCPPWSPGNGGPGGAPGAPGTGGIGGEGGVGGAIRHTAALQPLIKEGRVVLTNAGGQGGDPGDAGPVGRAGEPGKSGDGASCGDGGNGKDIPPPDPPDAALTPSPSKNGASGVIKCLDCR